MTSVAGGRDRIGAVLRETLLREEGAAIDDEADHHDDRHHGATPR